MKEFFAEAANANEIILQTVEEREVDERSFNELVHQLVNSLTMQRELGLASASLYSEANETEESKDNEGTDTD